MRSSAPWRPGSRPKTITEASVAPVRSATTSSAASMICSTANSPWTAVETFDPAADPYRLRKLRAADGLLRKAWEA